MFASLPYFSAKLFSFSCTRLLVCFRVDSPNLLVEFPFVFFFFFFFWNVLFCLYSFTLYIYLFNLPSFPSTFWFISSSFSFVFPCVAFYFLSQHVPAFFLCFIILVCFRKFFICVSIRISHPCFGLFFVLFEGISIFKQTYFALA